MPNYDFENSLGPYRDRVAEQPDQEPRKLKSGDVLMKCPKCGTWDFQDEFELDLENEVATCPNCGASDKVINHPVAYLP